MKADICHCKETKRVREALKGVTADRDSFPQHPAHLRDVTTLQRLTKAVTLLGQVRNPGGICVIGKSPLTLFSTLFTFPFSTLYGETENLKV